MLTLFTGLPGAGKTAAMLDLVNQQLKGRPVFVHFDEKERVRPEQKLLAETLKIPHARVNAAEWHKEVPDGAVLLVDEAQGVWRARASSSAVPPAIQAFETHRHAGIDVYMTTQGPKLVDSNLRSLVGRHVHIRSTGWMGRWWYEWDQIQVNAETAWQKCTNKRRYVLPKNVFGLYVSANEHTKPIRKIPPLLYVLVALILGVIVLTWQFIASRSKSEAAPLPGTTAQGVKASSHMEKQWIDDRIAFIPRVSNKPESAPAFDEIRRVVVMPVVAGGVCFKGVCRCVTQQGTDSGLSKQECKEWMERKPFDPYTAPPAPQKQAATAPRADEQGRADRPLSSVPLPAGMPINVRSDG